MNAHDEAAGGTVTLERMLAAREERAARQAAALARFDRPVMSMTVVTPGPVKDGSLPRRVLLAAVQELESVFTRNRWCVLSRETLWPSTGPEALYVIDVEARAIKLAAIELEDRHPLGRLWDLDILAPGQGAISRQGLGIPPRRCLVCEWPGHACGRSRRHSPEELSHAVWQVVHTYDLHPA
jgi:holo-ACP synthase